MNALSMGGQVSRILVPFGCPLSRISSEAPRSPPRSGRGQTCASLRLRWRRLLPTLNATLTYQGPCSDVGSLLSRDSQTAWVGNPFAEFYGA